MTVPNSPPPPRWISLLNIGIVLACLTAVVLAAFFQHKVVIGHAPQGQFFVVPSLVGLFFGILLVTVRRMMDINKSYGRVLAERNERIETLNRELEDRVAARTEELSVKHAQLLQAQRLELVGQLVGGVAHDINNLLTVIRGNVDVLKLGDVDNPLLSDVVDATERGQRLTKSLLATSRRDHAPKDLPVRELIDELVGLLRRAFGEGYTINVEHCEGTTATVDAGRLEQILLNLLVNSRDAQPGGGRMLVRTLNCGSDGVVLEVEDEGPGVPAELQDRIFETFFTTKAEEKGSGLGLSTVRLLATEAGGTVELRPSSNGACFRVELPAMARSNPQSETS
ncbi:MAG: ATP-binding protein [Woeseiaceae bacterium]|nr:ATP-binding protein [Woeseiaceae bacterium]